ncbi:hypothetical protein ACIBL6_20200 [Streptomyces sp. NPDC050400]|uniref:hypothetical protein n=1 Tax=Streptomyces sp. NPDC050400 TaxID=3365610 RepID=UPI003799C93D
MGAVLAAALTGALAVRRLRQRRARKPGQTPPDTMPAAVEGEVEQTAHDGANSIQRLQAALAALAEHSEGTPPPLRAARVTTDGVQVLPNEVTAEPAPPFTASRAGWWHLPDHITLPTASEAADPPYPTLVTLGTDPAGSLVLVNLAALDVFLVEGEPAEQAQIMACMATELAIGPHADHVEVLACGMGALGVDLTTLGVRYLPDPRLAAGEFAARILEAHQDPDDRGIPYIVICAGDLDDDTAWQLAETLDRTHDLTPCVLVLPATAGAVFPDAETIDAGIPDAQRVDALGVDVVLQRLDAVSLSELADAFQQTHRPAEGPHGMWEHVPPEPVEVPGSTPVAPEPRRPSSDAGEVPQPASSVSQALHPDALATAEASQPVAFQALMNASIDPGQAALAAVPAVPAAPAEGGEGPAGPAERIGPRFLIPPVHALLAPERTPPIPETDADQALSEAGPDDTAPRLRALGPLEMHHVDALEPRLIELAAHLLLKPDSGADRLCEDLGDGAPWSPKTLGSRLRELRTRLGTDVDGNPYVPHRKGKTSPYMLSDHVRCDWWEFERLAALGLSRGTDGLPYLERALALVDGIPLTGHPARWMTGLRTTMQARITDTAHTVASYRTSDGPHQDFPTARQACTVGLKADAHAEPLYRSLMRTEAAVGNRSGLQAAVAQWHNANRHLPREHLDKETLALADQLLAAS